MQSYFNCNILFYCCKAIQIATLPGDSKVRSCSQVDPSKSGRFFSEQRINKLEVPRTIVSASFLFQAIMQDIETLLHIAFQALSFSVFELREVYCIFENSQGSGKFKSRFLFIQNSIFIHVSIMISPKPGIVLFQQYLLEKNQILAFKHLLSYWFPEQETWFSLPLCRGVRYSKK